MQAVNKKMDPQKTLKTMQDFQKENMKMGMTEDMSKDPWHTHTQNDIGYLQADTNQIAKIGVNGGRSGACYAGNLLEKGSIESRET